MVDEYPSWSAYHYVMNNPLMYIDPIGMCAELINASAGSYEGEAARDLFQQHCSGVEPASQQLETDRDPEQNRSACVGLTCGDAGNFYFDSTVQTTSSQTNTGVLRSFVRGGIQFFDAVADAGAQMTVLTGGALIASLKTPTFLDTKTLAGLTAFSVLATVSADAAATVFSAADAFVYGGDVHEFVARANVTGISILVSGGTGYLYRAQLRRALLDAQVKRGLEGAATTTTSRTATYPFKKRNR